MNTKVTVQEVVDVLNSERHEWDKLRHIFAHRIQTHGIEVAYTPMTDDEWMRFYENNRIGAFKYFKHDFAKYEAEKILEKLFLDRLGVAPSLDQAKRICEEAGLAVVPKQDSAVFTEWLCREMPVGTIIGGAEWWAERIIKRFIPQAKLEAARGVE
jgi:hypothetical protein